MNQNDILSLLKQPDEDNRIPIDIAGYLGYKNISLYLLSKLGTPSDIVHQQINVDKTGRNVYHIMCYRGSFDCMVAHLNMERICYKKILFDQLHKEK